MCWARAGSPRAITAQSVSPSTPDKVMHVPSRGIGGGGGGQFHIQEHNQSLANCLLAGMEYLYCIKLALLDIWGIFFQTCKKRMRILNKLRTYKMIVLIHTIWHVIAELSLPAWQKEVRNITYEVIEAMKEAKKYHTMESHNCLMWLFIIILCGFFIMCCCCGASVANEQQHKQDLRRIYIRENEFSKSSLFTRMLCGFLPECIAPSTRVHCATNNTRL